MIRLLFNSRQRGRLALDSPDGHTLSTGQHISVKQGHFWIPGTVESDSEMYALVPDGGSWGERCPLVAGMTIDDYTTLEQNYPVSEKEWWTESPEEFASGFTEEVHVHYTGSEQKSVMGNKEKRHPHLRYTLNRCYADTSKRPCLYILSW